MAQQTWNERDRRGRQSGEDQRRSDDWDRSRDYGAGRGESRTFGGAGDVSLGDRGYEFGPTYGGYGASRYGTPYGRGHGESRYGARFDQSREPDRGRYRDYGHGGYGADRYGQSYGAGRAYGGGLSPGGRWDEGDRSWWDRTRDEVSSWVGDEEARRRRQQDEIRADKRGRGPKNYVRSDERIREDVNDRLTDDPWIDAHEVDVEVKNGEVTLSGTVDNSEEKRRAEDCADDVSGVKHVQNNLRFRPTETTTGAKASA